MERIKKKGKLWVLVLSVLLLSGGLLFGQQSKGGRLDKPAPDFTATLLDGKTLSLNSLKGKIVILNFWATWCRPCRNEIPEFIKFYQAHARQGVEILGISVDEDESSLRQFVQTSKIRYPITQDKSGQISSLYGGIRSIPTTFVIDRKGVIRNKFVGSLKEDQLIQALQPYLK
ncbi:MAG: TlpA disulfide reductase family protein [Candidatus Omnitrophota bacterium]